MAEDKVLIMHPYKKFSMDTEDTCEYRCDLTDEMDKHLIPGWRNAIKDFRRSGTYMLKFDHNRMAIRFPGATRGHIQFDNNMIITGIEFYGQCFSKGIGCYDESLLELMEKYIGYKVEFEKLACQVR